MATAERGIHLNDIGTKFLVTVAEDGSAKDISAGVVSTKKLLFRKPDDTEVFFAATYENTGVDGMIYVLSTADGSTGPKIDVAGRWELQAFIELVSGEKFTSDKYVFDVWDSIANA